MVIYISSDMACSWIVHVDNGYIYKFWYGVQ